MMKNIPKRIFLIITDTLRSDSLGVYGKNPSVTPSIDKLAKSGVVFNNAYASITKTDPSITSILTGKYPLSMGMVNHAFSINKQEQKNISKQIFLQEILSQNGYKTLAIDWLSRWYKKGYYYYSDKISDKTNYNNLVKNKHFLFRLTQYYLTKLDKFTTKLIGRDYFLHAYKAFLPNQDTYYDPANVVIDNAIEKLKVNRTEKKFIYIHLWDAHKPYTVSHGLISYLKNSAKDYYYEQIRFLDKQIGRLIDYLESSKLLDETLIILTADHGENFFEHDTPFNHENLYDDVVKVPLIINYSKFSPKTIKKLVQHVDIFPTILDMLDITPPKNIDGISLLSLISSGICKREFAYFEDIPLELFGFIEKKYRKRGLRIGDYKYIQTIDNKYNIDFSIVREDETIKFEELYNLKKDPPESVNLAFQNRVLTEKMRTNLNNLTLKLNKKNIKELNPQLHNKIKKSINVIKKCEVKLKNNIYIAFKGGKDTTVMMHIIKSIYGKIPLKVFFNDTTLEFKETYQFIEKMKKLWKLDLIVLKHDEQELKAYHKEKDKTKKSELARIMKINSIKRAVKKYKLKGFMLGIRRDENPARKKEKYFSKREDHIRIHPLLDWTEEDIWKYINHFGVPYSDLYKKGYRSVGEKPFTKKSKVSERSGREKDKEKTMAMLRQMGYW